MGKKQRKADKTAGTKRRTGKKDDIYYGYSSEEDMERAKSHSSGAENLRHSNINKKKDEGSSSSHVS